MERRNLALSEAHKQLLIYTIGGWIWVYNTAATIRQGAKSGTDAKVLKEKLSINWTGPSKIVAVGPSPSDSTPDGRSLAAKLLYLELPNDMPSLDAPCGVSVAQCKSCTTPHDTTGLPRYLAVGLTRYVLKHHTTRSTLFHVTADHVSVPVERVEVDKISSNRFIRGRGGAIAVLYETHWKGLLRPFWEREADLLHARQHILDYWAGAPLQLRQTSWVYHRMRVCAAQREHARSKGGRFLPPGNSYFNHHTWARRFLGTILPVGNYFWHKGQYHI